MARKNYGDPEGFDHSGPHAAFGFTGSAGKAPAAHAPHARRHTGPPTKTVIPTGNTPPAIPDVAPMPASSGPDMTSASPDLGSPTGMAHGGAMVEHADGRVTHHHADGTHHVVHADGRIIHHFADGGHMVHHVNGVSEHHFPFGGKKVMHTDGSHTLHMPDGSMEHHDASEFCSGGRAMAHGGGVHPDAAQDRALIREMASKAHIEMARGGHVPDIHARLPRGMRPTAERRHSPIETPPRNPNTTTTPRNEMSGGEMPYGVEPSAEPDNAGSEQGIPQLKAGGRARKMKA